MPQLSPNMPTHAPAPITSLSPARNTHATRNRTPSEGPVRDREDGKDEGNPTHVASRDAIQEKKEQAKAVMAASKINAGLASGESSPIHARPEQSTENVTYAANGMSTGRKRSRSGSRLSHHSSSAVIEQPSIQDFLLNRYIEHDSLHAAAMNDQAEASRNRMNYKLEERNYYLNLRQQRHLEPGSVFGYGFMGYGNGLTEQKQTRLEYPEKKKRPGNRRARVLRLSRQEKEQQADQLEELVPIRLDIELEKIKLRDTFTWNLHDRIIPADIFAENLVEDFQVPFESAGALAQRVHHEIQEQIQDFYPHIYIEEQPLDPHLPYHAYKNDEMRILVKLNITIGQHTLVDQFEWELNNPANSPEEFAKLTARELSLSGEFETAIAHSIREQCQMYTKSLYITGHPFDGRPIEDADVRESLLPSPLLSVFRHMQTAKDYSPYLYELNDQEMERTELSMLREQRRQKRSTNRRGGPALPDLKDRQRTVRTLIVSSVLPGAADSLHESRLYKISRSSGRNRRGAPRVDGIDDSDESDESESGADSPAPSQVVPGGSRTRAPRGAAMQATRAITSAGLARSATPELAALPEIRTSRRFPVAEPDEGIVETYIVKLRVDKDKLRMLAQGSKIAGTASLVTPSTSTRAVSQRSTPAASSMPPPPSPAVGVSPRLQPSGLPVNSHQQIHYYADGRTDAPYPIPSGHTAPPPPPWLTNALRKLQDKYPQDEFEALMRYSTIDKTTQHQVRLETLPPGQPPPPNIKHQYLPRIRCNDCPGKLYTAGPELTVDNFEVHLKNRGHRGKVEERRRRPSGS